MMGHKNAKEAKKKLQEYKQKIGEKVHARENFQLQLFLTFHMLYFLYRGLPCFCNIASFYWHIMLDSD